MNNQMKVVLVHDWITGMRGGERVLEALCELFPEADLFTLVWEKGSASSVIENRKVKTSLLQKMPFGKSKYRYYLPLLPFFADRLDLSGYDLVISSSHAVAKNVKVDSHALHVSYVHTPMRYVWDMFDHYFGEGTSFSQSVKLAAKAIRPYLQKQDVRKSDRVHHYITNSDFVGNRVKKYYDREYIVIHPPVDVEEFIPKKVVKKSDYYVIVSALVPYKRIDLAVEAFNKLNKNLVIIGSGSEMDRLQNMAGRNIKFTDYLERKEMIKTLQRAKGFIYPQIEDFGITAVESQAAGTPVIAFNKGGATETIVEGTTGVLFDKQDVDSLAEAVKRLEKKSWDANKLIENARRFEKKVFKEKISQYIDDKWLDWKGKTS